MASAVSPKQLVRAALTGRPVSRPPFIPLLGEYAAKVEQVSVQEMMTDLALLTRALDDSRRLFDCDAIVVGVDSTIEAEACGCAVEWSQDGMVPAVTSHPLADGPAVDDAAIEGIGGAGRLPVTLEATRRLVATSGRNVAIIARVTGVLTLASHLLGADVVDLLAEASPDAERALELSGKVAAKVCRLYADLNVDAVVFAEHLLSRSQPTLISSRVKRAMQQSLNVAKYYNLGTVVLARGRFEAPQAQAIGALGASALALGGSGLQAAQILGENRRVAMGLAVPLALLAAEKKEIADRLPGLLSVEDSNWRFLTTECEIPFDTPVDCIHEVARVYRDFVAQMA